MPRCNGKGYPGCDSCINRELDPFQCDTCEDESNYEGDDGSAEDDTSEDFTVAEFIDRFGDLS